MLNNTIQNLHSLGFNIVPLARNSKLPIAGFPLRRFFGEQFPITELEEVIENDSNINYGVITGRVSQIIVVDFDSPEALNFFESTYGTIVAPTATTVKPNRMHTYWKYPSYLMDGESVSSPTNYLHPNLDVRADLSYAVAPSSVINSIPYAWIEEPLTADAFPELPIEFISGLIRRSDGTRLTNNRNTATDRLDILTSNNVSPNDTSINTLLNTIGFAPEGKRNTTLYRASKDILKQLSNTSENTLDTLDSIIEMALQNGLPLNEIDKTINSAVTSLLNNRQPAVELRNIIPDGLQKYYNNNLDALNLNNIGFTDTDNAQLFVNLHNGFVLYNLKEKKWFVREGHYWKKDDTTVQALVRTLGTLRAEYAKAGFDNGSKKELVSAAKSLQSSSRIQSTISVVQTYKEVIDDDIEWDSQEHYLCVKNGIIDLRTGELRQRVDDDNFKSHLDINYDPSAMCPKFIKFINDIRDNDVEDIEVLQQLLGMSITGTTKERLFFLLYGKGSNGKGVLFKLMQNILGTYHIGINEQTFRSGYNDAAKQSVKFVGKRLVTIAELGTDTKFDEALLKSIVAADSMTIKPLYQEEQPYTPQFKLWLSSNVPIQMGRSDAMSERLIVIPCTRQFKNDNTNTNLSKELFEEREGILAWLVQGSINWYNITKDGSSIRGSIPERWNKATTEYWSECDAIQTFIETCCELRPNARIKPSLLYQTYSIWAADGGYPFETQTAFGRRIRRQFTKVSNLYEGIALKNTSLSSNTNIANNSTTIS